MDPEWPPILKRAIIQLRDEISDQRHELDLEKEEYDYKKRVLDIDAALVQRERNSLNKGRDSLTAAELAMKEALAGCVLARDAAVSKSEATAMYLRCTIALSSVLAILLAYVAAVS